MIVTVLAGVVAVIGGLILIYRGSTWWQHALWALLVGSVSLCALGPLLVIKLYGAVMALWLLIFAPTPLRRLLLTGPVYRLYKRILPMMSSTEREAIAAGTVWWDGQLFSGHPNWNDLLAIVPAQLSVEELAFLDHEVETLCAMLDDWAITTELNDLPADVWQYIKAHGFFGLIIPKAYGGKGFSNYAHSQVVVKLATRSASAAVTVMVPNSLGPAELLLHYGTETQKNHYLPRLARGDEVPCFALTSPDAGSDAGSIPDFGIVCKGQWQGNEVLGIRLTWDKRYITLCPVATLLGLAFRLYDPDLLLGASRDIGITLALIPTHHPGVHTGRRHWPLNMAFMNGPTWGQDVFIPLDFLVGGTAFIGQGWRMLMECLAVGRSISLPSMGAASAKMAAFTTGAYARVRTQFNQPIARFEGVEEALARIGGMGYLMEGARGLTLSGLDAGQKPSVISAIMKYHLTERMRSVMNDAMDVHGGKGICMGPNNYLARAYQSLPIGITVEGANILTRSMIIFGQGAIRCHPYVLKEMQAAHNSNTRQGLRDFDQVFSAHLGFVVRNKVRCLLLGLSGAHGVGVPLSGRAGRYLQLMSRQAAQLAFLTDVTLFVLGGRLKFRESLSARLGDVLAGLYLASGAIKRFADHGQLHDDEDFLAWAVERTLFENQQALLGLVRNFPIRVLRPFLRWQLFPLGAKLQPPSDRVAHRIAMALTQDSPARRRLTEGVYAPHDNAPGVGVLLAAFNAVLQFEPLEAKVRAASRAGTLTSSGPSARLDEALAKNILTTAEYNDLRRLRELKRATIMVDDFDGHLCSSNARLSERPVL